MFWSAIDRDPALFGTSTGPMFWSTREPGSTRVFIDLKTIWAASVGGFVIFLIGQDFLVDLQLLDSRQLRPAGDACTAHGPNSTTASENCCSLTLASS